MKPNNKLILSGFFFAFFLFVFTIISTVASAQAPNFLNPPTATSSIPEFIKSFYDFALIVAGVLAVGVIVVGGIYYSVSGAVDKKGEGKTMILGALWGLGLLLGAYVILRTINPQLVNLGAPPLPEVGFNQCTEEKFKEGKLGNIGKCGVENFEWPIDFNTGECRCYVDKAWQKENTIRLEETEGVNLVFKDGEKGPPPSQTGCCTTIDKTIIVKNNNQVDRGVNELLVRLKNVQGVPGWRVTEACPPTSNHESSCHKSGNCSCVDIALFPKTGKCTDVQALISAAKQVGFKVLNEYTQCKGTQTKFGTGGHIHVGI